MTDQHPSAVAPLSDYATERARLYDPPGDSKAFFRTDRGDRVSYRAANHTFAVLRQQLGWSAVGRTHAPRVHDLRRRDFRADHRGVPLVGDRNLGQRLYHR